MRSLEEHGKLTTCIELDFWGLQHRTMHVVMVTDQVRPGCTTHHKDTGCTVWLLQQLVMKIASMCHAVALTFTSASRYTDQDYDAEFVTVLQQQCYQYIKQAGDPSLQDISNFIHDKVEMLAITPW